MHGLAFSRQCVRGSWELSNIIEMFLFFFSFLKERDNLEMFLKVLKLHGEVN